MNTELQIFDYGEKEVRTVQKDSETWFVLKDVCDVLEMGNHRNVANRLDEDEKGVHRVDTLGGKQQTTIINESGLYNVILRSDKPEAKQFKRWVTHEVLPTLRKHGAYMTPETIENLLANPDSAIKLFTALKNERIQKEQLQLEAEQNAPKIIFANSVAASDDTILIRELAKILKGNGINVGEKRLFEQLREDGFLIKARNDDYNTPTQRAMNLGLFKLKETTIQHADGNVYTRRTPKVTGKGQLYFVNYFTDKSKGA